MAVPAEPAQERKWGTRAEGNRTLPEGRRKVIGEGQSLAWSSFTD